MFEALRALQIVVWLGVVVLSAVLARRLFVGGIDGAPILRRLRGASRARILEVLARTPAPLSLLAIGGDVVDDEEASVRLREQALLAERHAARGLAWLRIVGLSASAIGFIAVAHQIAWLNADHGLLDLDPTRVGRMASERAAIALALAVAASGTAMMLGTILRARVRTLLRELATGQDLLDRASPTAASGGEP